MTIEAVPWKDSYKTGIRAIDADHRMLFDIVNALIREANGKSSADEIGSTFHALQQYVDTHFEREERFLEQCGYPDLENHKKLHQKLREKVIGIEKLYHANPTKLDLEAVCKFLSDWLVQHIMTSDMAYVPSIRAQASHGKARRKTENVTVKVPSTDVHLIKILAGEISSSPSFAESFRKFMEGHKDKQGTLYEKPSISNFYKRRR